MEQQHIQFTPTLIAFQETPVVAAFSAVVDGQPYWIQRNVKPQEEFWTVDPLLQSELHIPRRLFGTAEEVQQQIRQAGGLGEEKTLTVEMDCGHQQRVEEDDAGIWFGDVFLGETQDDAELYAADNGLACMSCVEDL